MNEPELRHRLAAILVADAAGYSRLMAGDDRAALAALDAARDVFRSHVQANDGRVVDTAGDSVLAVFVTAAGAVNAALGVQRQLAVSLRAKPATERLRFRIGIHLGDVLEKPDGSVYGDGVNVAARMQALSDSGGVVVSHAVHGAVQSQIRAHFEDLGEQRLKNIAAPVRAYRLRQGGHIEPSAGPVIQFGNAEVWPQRRKLRIAGEDVSLGGRAFDLLLALIDRRDRVVSRNELYDLVWPGRVVEDNNLDVQVLALRKLLGTQVIATVPGRGYRFTAVLDDDPSEPEPTDSPAKLRTGAAPGPEPLAPPGVPPRMLGRDNDLAALESLLQQHRCVTVVGAGGIGKTTLALAAAHARRAVHRDGIAWVDLSSVSQPTMVIPAVAQALQLPAIRGERSLAALVASLKPLQLLLVLDNAEQLVEEVGRLVHATTTGAPAVHLLVTSQVPLRVADERVLRLGPLAVPGSGTSAGDAMNHGAVALFVDQARSADARFGLTDENVAMVIDLCLHLEGLALAIKLAAARTAFFGLHGLEQHLAERLKLLAGGSRSAPTRQQTLRAALDWSYGLLAEPEKAALRALGVFAGGFTLELAGMVVGAGEDQWTVIEHVSTLADRSLVSVDSGDPPRYRLLESVREYASAQLDEARETHEMRHRHARAMLSLCDELVPTAPDDDIAERYGRDIDNLRTAIDWSASNDPHLAIALVGASALVFYALNLTREVRRHCEALEPALASHPSRARAARFWLVRAAIYPSPTVASGACASKAATLYRELSDPLTLHTALCYIGLSAFANTEAAEQALAEAVTLERPDWPARAISRRLFAQGIVHWANLRYAPLQVASEQAATLGRAAGFHNFAANCTGVVARAQLALGELDGALATSQALLAQEATRRGGLLTYAWGTRALCLTMHGDLAEARAAWAEFFGQCRREDWERIREFSEGYLHLAMAERRYATAARLRGYAWETIVQLGWSTALVERITQRDLYGPELRGALDEGTIVRLAAEGRRLDAEAVCAMTLATVDQLP